MSEHSSLVVEIKNEAPVELVDLTTSLTALARQYQRHAARQEDGSKHDAKLYIKEMRSGSIVAELTPYIDQAQAAVEQLAPLAGPAKELLGFAKHLKNGIDALVKGTKPPEEMSG